MNSTKTHAPQAAVLFDKFHVMRHLGEALDKVHRSEYHRLSGKDKAFVKGQRYNLLSRWETLSLNGRQALRKLLSANKRLQTAYLLKESFDQLWGYSREGWARRFFDHWKESLKWQRLKPFEKFAAMVERNWSGIAAYCESEEKFSLGFVEGVNTKIRVIQRRAYGLRAEEYIPLKILTCMLPERGGGRRPRPRAGGPGGGRYRGIPWSALRPAGRRRGIREVPGGVVRPGGRRAGGGERVRGGHGPGVGPRRGLHAE